MVVRDEGALRVFYLSLALIIMGVGFLKPNVSTIVGRLYAENDPRRDSGFSLFVAGINLGGLFASIVCGYLGETYGWKYGFGAAGIGMLLGLAQFLWGRKYLRGIAEPPEPLSRSREWTIYALAIARPAAGGLADGRGDLDPASAPTPSAGPTTSSSWPWPASSGRCGTACAATTPRQAAARLRAVAAGVRADRPGGDLAVVSATACSTSSSRKRRWRWC